MAGGQGTNSTTGLVQKITQYSTTLTYAYDNVGNITSVADGSKTVSYVYDKLGQLTRANDPYDTTAGSSGTTWVYTYDQGGNITQKDAYAYTTGTVGTAVQTIPYTYGDSNWKDKLTAYNGTAISYDAIGNPTSDGTWTYTWAKGRQLQKMTKSGETATFTYNADGLRVKKVCTTTGTTKYILHGKNIVHLINGSNNLHFFYDAQNRPAIVVYNGTAYGYVHNLQGDIIAIIDSAGTKVVEYKYDAWGKPLSKTGSMASTLGKWNPFRYRSYVYDEETNLYYLRSRYYNPMWKRFINADCINKAFVACRVDNCFTYCNNCPTMYIDLNGNAGQFFDLGQGWHWRIDPASSNGKLQRHIHIWKDGGDSFAQNEDGSVHDGLSGNPPKWIQKKLKDLNKWSWKYEHDTPNQSATPAPSSKPTPSPSPTPNPTPAPGPAPVVIPASDEYTVEDQSFSPSNGLTVTNTITGIGFGALVYLSIKLLAAIPSAGWSLAIP